MTIQPLAVSTYYAYGVRLGLRAVLRGHVIPGAKRLLNPVSFWRCIEIPWVFDAIRAEPGDWVLDVGSPKQLALFLADRVGCRIAAIDLLPGFVGECRDLLEASDLLALWNRRFFALPQDGRRLPYRDEAFDKVYSISVIEHIPGAGDSVAIKEIARVLKPGGTAAITVPFSTRFREEFVDRDVYERKRTSGTPVFYQRVYDRAALEARLLGPSGLGVEARSFFTGFDLWDRGYMRLPLVLRAALAPLQPPLARVMIRAIDEAEVDPDRYNLACLRLRKTPRC